MSVSRTMPEPRLREDDLRIVIIGTSCSGKSTLAARLAHELDRPHVHLDALHWLPNWTARNAEDFAAQVEAATRGPAWVADGNYSPVRDLLWSRATTLIWLNYRFATVLYRSLRRTIRRAWTGQELFNGNRETFLKALASRDSILLWVLRSHPKLRREYPRLFRNPRFAALRVIELRSQSDADRLIAATASTALKVQNRLMGR